MDLNQLNDQESSSKKNNGKLKFKHEFNDVYTESPVIQSSNGKIEDESPSSLSPKSANEGKSKPLKKWRRIRRDFTKSISPEFPKVQSPNRALPDSSDSVQINKRRIQLPDSSRNGPSDPADDVELEEESSIASVESRYTGLSETPNFAANPVAPLDPDSQLLISTPIFSIGAVDSENSEDRSSKSSTFATAPRGRDRAWLKGSSVFATNQRAPRVRGTDTNRKTHLKFETENSNSNSNAAVSNGKMSEKSVNYDGGENSGEEVRSAYRRENGETGNPNPAELDSRFEEGKDGFEIPDLDPVGESVKVLQAAEESLEAELEKWMEIGKEEMEEESEEIEWEDLLDPKFEIQELNEKMNHLKFQLEEALNSLAQKDSRLFQLESHLNQTLIQSEFDQLIQDKLEFEIQSLVITKTVLKWERTLQDSKAFVEEQKSLISEHRKLNLNLRELVVLKENSEKLEDELKEKSDKLEILDAKSKMYETSLVYFIELVLIGLMLVMLLMVLLPPSSDVVPT